MDAGIDTSPPVEREITYCVQQAADTYDVPDLLIRSILHVESQTGSYPGGRIGETKDEGRGVYAIGPMQVTSIWLNELSKHGVTEKNLTWDWCTNVTVGTWILRNYYDEFGADWTKAIMAYNAGYRLQNGRRYAEKVIDKWHFLYESALEDKGGSQPELASRS